MRSCIDHLTLTGPGPGHELDNSESFSIYCEKVLVFLSTLAPSDLLPSLSGHLLLALNCSLRVEAGQSIVGNGFVKT